MVRQSEDIWRFRRDDSFNIKNEPAKSAEGPKELAAIGELAIAGRGSKKRASRCRPVSESRQDRASVVPLGACRPWAALEVVQTLQRLPLTVNTSEDTDNQKHSNHVALI